MALLTKEGYYVRLMDNGNYEIYRTKEDRDKVKNSSHTYEEVLARYNELINELCPDEEDLYYLSKEEIEEQFPLYPGIINESIRYAYDCQLKHGGGSYPIIERYIPDASESIPNLIESGSIFTGADTPESYEKAKKNMNWGETEDV